MTRLWGLDRLKIQVCGTVSAPSDPCLDSSDLLTGKEEIALTGGFQSRVIRSSGLDQGIADPAALLSLAMGLPGARGYGMDETIWINKMGEQ